MDDDTIEDKLAILSNLHKISFVKCVVRWALLENFLLQVFTQKDRVSADFEFKMTK